MTTVFALHIWSLWCVFLQNLSFACQHISAIETLVSRNDLLCTEWDVTVKPDLLMILTIVKKQDEKFSSDVGAHVLT